MFTVNSCRLPNTGCLRRGFWLFAAASQGKGIENMRSKKMKAIVQEQARQRNSAATFRSPSFRRLPRQVPAEMILALIHDAIAHMIVPITKIGDASSAFERIARTLEKGALRVSPRAGGARAKGKGKKLDNWATAIEHAPVPFGLLTTDFRILSCNRAMADLLRSRQAGLIGRSAWDFVDPVDRPLRADDLRGRLLRGSSAEWRGKIQAGDGTRRQVHSFIWPIRLGTSAEIVACGVIDFLVNRRPAA